jgi:ribosomal protein S18 acetylase RimI-like enzyme
MKLVTDIAEVTDAYNFAKEFKKGFNTNCFVTTEQFSKLIKNGMLYQVYLGEVAFLLKKNKGFLNLYYYAASIDELAKSLPLIHATTNNETIVVDLVTKNELFKEKLVFEENQFNVYTSLIRMSRLGNIRHEEGSNLKNVRNAKPKDAVVVRQLLTTYFDPRAEQLPDMDNLAGWIKENNIILFEEQGKVVGFIIYDLKATTLYLKYWFVHPDFRDLKIGSQLFKEFLVRGKDTQRQLFWVIRSNENAIKRYLHYGFKEEKMYNYVLINRQIKYEN